MELLLREISLGGVHKALKYLEMTTFGVTRFPLGTSPCVCSGVHVSGELQEDTDLTALCMRAWCILAVALSYTTASVSKVDAVFLVPSSASLPIPRRMPGTEWAKCSSAGAGPTLRFLWGQGGGVD